MLQICGQYVERGCISPASVASTANDCSSATKIVTANKYGIFRADGIGGRTDRVT